VPLVFEAKKEPLTNHHVGDLWTIFRTCRGRYTSFCATIRLLALNQRYRHLSGEASLGPSWNPRAVEVAFCGRMSAPAPCGAACSAAGGPRRHSGAAHKAPRRKGIGSCVCGATWLWPAPSLKVVVDPRSSLSFAAEYTLLKTAAARRAPVVHPVGDSLKLYGDLGGGYLMSAVGTSHLGGYAAPDTARIR
jgi:hypothetical protein